MTKPEKKALVPALRFPEFRDGGEWAAKQIGYVSETVTAGGTPSTTEKEYWGGNIRWMNSGELNYKKVYEVQGRITESGLQNSSTKIIPKMCVLIGLAGQGKTRGTVAMNMIDLCINQSIAAIFPNEDNFSSEFLYHNLDNRYDELRSLSAGGEGRGGLNIQIIKSLKIPLPSLKEQQKIADCLSSLDDLITAQTQKLATLKAHKKGLMQQLFPAEGETVPKLRFPEFRDGGEWLEICLKELCERIMDGTHFSPKTKDGSRMYLTSKNIQDGKINLSNISYISEEEHNVIYEKCPVKLNDVLLTKDGANTGNCALNTIDSEFSLLSSVAVLRGNASLIDQGFLYQMILSDKTQRIIKESMSGQAITRITLDKIGNFTISITDLKEQQKIADCLSSIDELITAQSQKIEALKSHKKGLMQQLFPRMDEDNHPPPAAYPSRGGELRDEPFPSSGGVDSEAGRGGSPPTTGRGD